jgi:hypothetical protein
MRRVLVGIVSITLALAFVAPLTASAAVPPSKAYMLREQVASQRMIDTLLGVASSSKYWVTTISFGHVTKSSTKAVINVTVHTRASSSVSGVLVMYKYSGKWYFYSITRGSSAGGISNVAIPAGITSSVVSNAIHEESTHQYLVAGIVSGGYKKLTVTSRYSNVGTRQVNIRLSGGSRRSTTGRVLAYSKKASNGTKYWFISVIK